MALNKATQNALLIHHKFGKVIKLKPNLHPPIMNVPIRKVIHCYTNIDFIDVRNSLGQCIKKRSYYHSESFSLVPQH